MSISFVYPYALWLLLLVPLTVGLALAGPRRPTLRRFWSGLALRAALLTLIVLALAGIQLRLRSDLLTVVFVLDVSDSVPAEQAAYGEQYISASIQNKTENGNPYDRAAIVLFGKDALVERLASEEDRLAELTSVPVTSRTDIASAVQLALALFPDEGARRIVLLSDGRENLGEAVAQAELASAHGIELSFVPLSGPEGEVEVLVGSLSAPAAVRVGQGFDLEAVIESSAATSATVRFFGENQLLDTREVNLTEGVNRLVLPLTADQTGFQRYRVQIVPDSDTRLQNNEASAFTVISGPPRVLVVEGTAGEAENLQRALETIEMDVQVVSSAGIPISLEGLAAYDAVVLVNAPADGLPSGVMDNLQVYVRDLGKGLIMIGGENSFGAGGYLRTALEETLPVDMDVRSRQQTPNIALALVVDKSGSMGRCHCDDPDLNQTYERAEVGQPKVDIAKAAIVEAASALGRNDYIGVVAFDNVPQWALEMRQLVDAVTLEQAIGGIAANGQTNVYAGVEAAYEGLKNQEARIKHVILLTDGWTTAGDMIGLAHEMEEAGITLSVVAAGGGSAEYLKEMAEAGGGRYYPAQDILRVPEFFLKETVKAAGRYIIEEPFYPLPVEAGSAVLRGLNPAQLPALFGYNGSTPKGTARVVLSTPAGDPLLATWQYGLGKAAVWTSDLKAKWADPWMDWEGFGQFASQLVAFVLPAPQVEGVTARFSFSEGQGVLSVDAVGQDGLPRNFLEINARLVDPNLGVREVTLEQVGPGRYEARLEADQDGAYLAQLELRQGETSLGQQTVGLVVPYSPEYRSGGTNLSLLEELARLTGGSQLSDPLNVFIHNLPSAARAREIWAPLLWAVALLFPLDIALRRVMLSSEQFRSAAAWVSTHLGLDQLRRRAGRLSEEPLLGELFNARQRARTRRGRTEAEKKPAPAPTRTDTAEKPVSQPPAVEKAAEPAPQRQPPPKAEEAQESKASAEMDTLQRLKEAKRRRKG